MQPINGYVMIEPISERDKLKERLTSLGMVSKEVGVQGTPNQGVVRFMDNNLKVDFKVGDKVVFNEPIPDGFKIGENGYIPVKVEKVQAVINET